MRVSRERSKRERAHLARDNEARTALATLQRLGVDASTLERADLYRFEVESDRADALVATLRTLETVFNPNKHVLRVREASEPLPGEVWIDEPAAAARPANAGDGAVRFGGRVLAGVRRVERFTAWRIGEVGGFPARPEVVDAATQTLLCNPAFQRATR